MYHQKFWSEGNQEHFYFPPLDAPALENAAEMNQSPPEAAPDHINARKNVDMPIMAHQLTRDRLDVKGKNHKNRTVLGYKNSYCKLM